MMQVAWTRYGNPIWIDWKIVQNNEVIGIFQQFDNSEESFDAWSSFEALGVRAISKSDQSIFRRLYRDAETHYRETELNFEERETMAKALNIKSPVDRLNYGRSLLKKEFKDF